MNRSYRNGIFLSYARNDGENFATALREKLRNEAPDISLKQDRLILEGGTGWWKQLADAIDSVEFLVLIMTPAAMQSPMVRKEWHYARQQGVCVYPVIAGSDWQLDFSQLPHWMTKSHFFDIDKQWETFLAHLRKGCETPRVPFMAPDLPETFIPRHDEFNRLKDMLLSSDRNQAVAITTALSGAGGFGKTTLAAAICHDPDIIQNFDDGILWVTLGQNPNMLGSIATIYAALTGERPGFASDEDAGFQLGEKLEDRTCLLVIDDAWDDRHLRPFLRGGKACGRLFTTRNAQLALNALTVNVDEMRQSESLALLSKGIAGVGPARLLELSRKLGEWPIALELARAMLRQRIEQGDSAENAASRLLQILRKRGPQALAINGVIESSLALLNREDRQHLAELSIFPEDVAIPLVAAATLWQLDEIDSEEAANRFARLNLLKLDLGHGCMRIHDVMRGWLASSTPNAAELHNRLIAAWPDWMKLPHGYAWRWLTWHLAEAGRTAEIEGMLLDPAWLRAKLEATDVNALVSDFDRLKSVPAAALIQGAIRLSSNILATDSRQLAPQLIGRLLPHNEQPALQRFTERAAELATFPWLRPLRPALDPPGTGLVRTLVGHSFYVTSVTLTPDGREAISASQDETLKIWDLATGGILRTLSGHSHRVNDVAVTSDGRRAVSASDDDTLKIWDLESRTELRTLLGHSDAVNGVALCPQGKQLVSASADHRLIVWDLESGSELRALVGHSDAVNAVAITPNGQLAVSASSDRKLKLWKLDTGLELRTFSGHSGAVTGVAVSPDGRWFVSASHDQTLKIWDVELGTVRHTLTGHSHRVTSVVITPDGRKIISASYDKTLKVWDCETGTEQRTFAGHSDFVRGVAVSPDGQFAVSASYDETLKVWDLETGPELRTLVGHFSSVDGVAVGSDKHFAVSASYDQTLKVWDLATGNELRTLSGHAHGITAVALTGDGRRAVSASYDETLKVWDLQSGSKLLTLSGHSHLVTGVALTSDGSKAVSASFDTTLKVWDLDSGIELRTLDGHTQVVNGVAISKDGSRIVSVSGDGTLKLWDLESGLLLRTLTGHLSAVNCVALADDSRTAVSGSADKTLRVWDLIAGVEVLTLIGHSDAVTGVALSTDGLRVASTSEDRTLKVWELESGNLIASFTCDTAVKCCAFSDVNTILAGDSAGRLHLLLLEFKKEVFLLHSRQASN